MDKRKAPRFDGFVGRGAKAIRLGNRVSGDMRWQGSLIG